MKKALILTYYFPPHNGVAGWRAYSWSRYLHKYKIYPTIMTRHWQGNENKWDDSTREDTRPPVIEQQEHSSVLFLPFQHSLLKKIAGTFIFKIKIISKLFYFFTLLIGRFSIEIDAYNMFKKELKSYLKEHQFDMVIITAPPQNLVRLGYYIEKKYKIPVILDFRDLWDNEELRDDYKPGFRKRISNAIKKFYLKRWLKNVSLITTVSQSLAEKISSLVPQKVVEITNGFEAELFTNEPKKNSDFFVISYIGTIYPQLDLSIIIQGLNKFISQVGSQKIRLNFIGTEAIDSVAEKIKQNLPEECLLITPRISKAEAITYTTNSDVLLHAAFKTYKGIYTGKLFYYLGAKKNILIAPGDEDVIEALIKKTDAGKVAHSVDEFYAALLGWYEEWKKAGTVPYYGKQHIISNYTREHQAKLFAEELLSVINE